MIEMHDGIEVIRDDLYRGGTKARYLRVLFEQHSEVVYASPVCGGAQIALATVAADMGRKATIFCAARRVRHPRTNQAESLGAEIVEVRPGYLSVTRSKAQRYCEETMAYLAPFGLNIPSAVPSIAKAALAHSPDTPDEVWCAGGSGTLSRGLQQAWPKAEHHVVQVGHELSWMDIGAAIVHKTPYRFEDACKNHPPFPCDHHYEAKAWWICVDRTIPIGRRVVFWNVLS